MKKWLALAGCAVVAAAALVPVGGGAVAAASSAPRPAPLDLSGFSDARPATPLSLLFIHHSCGGQLLAPPGAESERARCIYEGHPNGGNLRALLEGQGYVVHEASYGSDIGDKTDIFDWPPKFRDKMDKVLRTRQNDELLPSGEPNRVVVFKSCFPSNDFVGEGAAPGNPTGPELTLWNAKAALSSLLPELEKHPDTLFVYVTAPANAPVAPPERAWKWLAKTILGKPHASDTIARAAALARAFNTWASASDGWLKGYRGRNVVVFDYYDVLTKHGASDLSAYATDGGRDSHPSREGNVEAAKEFVPFLNRAVHRAGLTEAGARSLAAELR